MNTKGNLFESMKGCDSLDLILKEYRQALDKDSDALSDNAEFMQLKELHFLVKNVRELTDIQLYQTYSKADTVSFKPSDTLVATGASPEESMVLAQKTYNDRQQLSAKIELYDKTLKDLDAYILKRVGLAEQAGLKIPRVLRISRKYGFSKHEEDIFLLMTVMQGSKNNQVLNSLVEEDYYRKVTGFQRLSNMCEVDIDIFCDGERQHMKEGIVLVDEDNGAQINLRIQRVAVQLLYGRQVRSDDLLKISQTSLEEILQQEGFTAASPGREGVPVLSRMPSAQSQGSPRASSGTANGAGHNDHKRKRLPLSGAMSLEDLPLEARQLLAEQLQLAGVSMKDVQMSGSQDSQDEGDDDNEGSEGSEGSEDSCETGDSDKDDGAEGDEADVVEGSQGMEVEGADRAERSSLKRPRREISVDVTTNASASTPSASGAGTNAGVAVPLGVAVASPSAGGISSADSSALKPYPAEGQLEFLDDCFQMIALMIKGNVARMKDDMKKEGTTSRYNSYEGSGELKHSRRELAAKLRLQESRIQIRLKKTAEAGHPLPRLEVMNQRFNLDPFEKKIILLLIGKTVSPIVKTLMETLDSSNRVAEDVLTVGQALSILCPDFHSQIAHRRYFYQSSRLLMNAIISLAKSKWHVGSGDLTENRITLDRRILDWVVGLDSEINELVEGSDLYEPVVELSQVVLPQGYAESILSQCSSYDLFQTYRQQIGLHKSISYGNSLVILLCGKSGTGKTMTVNAIAHELKKKVLLVDFNSLLNKKDGGGGDLEVDLKGLFRESKMSNTVLFFDECEVIFKSRNMGSERLLNSLLTEIERHEGIVFMATNRPYEIDEAMHRRINMVLEYAPPDYSMRKRIWDSLLGSERVKANSPAAMEAPDTSSTELNGAAVSSASNSAAPAAASKGKKASKKAAATNASTGSKDMPKLGLFPVASPAAVQTGSMQAAAKGIPLAEDVNTSELAVRYELTGGFIKNAVLSALLTALSRHPTHPVVTQADLIAGCKLQMRGNLSQRNFEDRSPSSRGIKDIFLTPDHRKQVEKIVRHENARSKVYGEWSVDPASAGEAAGAVLPTLRCEQRASINLFAGTRGSGKNTLAEAISCELGGKRIKYIHASDFVGQGVAEITSIFKVLVHDARIMDAMIIIDGFEHILDDGVAEGGGGSSKLQVVLSRVMDILHAFQGCVCLLCHMENPQNIMLQREFATRLFSFLRFTIAGHEIRTALWQALIPPGATRPQSQPDSSSSSSAGSKKQQGLSFEQLGRRFELNAGSIRSAIASAVSEAAMRTGDDAIVRQADLIAAGEHEMEKLKGGNFDITSKLFT